MTIVTADPNIVKLPEGTCCNKGYNRKLKRGQAVELALVEHFRQLLPYETDVYEGTRQFLDNYDPKYLAAIARNGGRHLTPEQYMNPKMNLSALYEHWGSWYKVFTLFQRDIWVQLPGKTIDIEVKSRNLGGFKYPTVYIGKAKGWQERRFKPDILVIIDDSTGEARYIDINQTRLAGQWQLLEASESHNNDECYKVPIEAFRPLSDLIEYLVSYGTALAMQLEKSKYVKSN